MLTVHLLGYTHVTYNDRPVCLSAKAVALITYLALEKLPQHRERLADLLWTTAEARKNLRVELARIRAAGLDIFPLSRQLLFLEEVSTDLDLWEERLSGDMGQADLANWLAMLRGLPLSGLEDLGSSAFQEWMDQQRWVLSERAEQVLNRAYWQFERANKAWAGRSIVARAEAMGFEHPGHSEPDLEAVQPVLPAAVQAVAQARPLGTLNIEAQSLEQLHFQDLGREAAFAAALERAQEAPQLLVLHGPAGSGKSYLAARELAASDWLTIQVNNSRMSRLVLATIAMALSREVEGGVAEMLTDMLLHPGGLEEDFVKLSLAAASLTRPLAIVLDHAQNAPVELASLLEFVLQAPAHGPRALVLLSRSNCDGAPLCRSLLRRFDLANTLRLELTPLSLTSVRQALETLDPSQGPTEVHLRAAQLVQRSEGNPLYLRHLLAAGTAQPTPGDRLPEAVRRSYAGEIDGWPAALREVLGSLSVLNGDFDLPLAQAALGAERREGVTAALRDALERRSLVEVEAEGPLRLPEFTPLSTTPQAEPRYRFRSEGLRVTLAGRVPHMERQEVRRRLVPALAPVQPGLALYYAERAGLGLETEALRRAYHERLEADSPLRGLPEAARLAAPRAPEPRPSGLLAGSTSKWQGYLLSWEQGGWLSVVSQGLFGHPQTLKLQLNLPELNQSGAPVELRLVWRLDVFQGGEELGPTLAPFPLRLGVLGAGTAHVLTSRATPDYHEEARTHQTSPDVTLGQWLEHRVTLSPAELVSGTLELSVRALDVALTVAELSVGGQPLLPLAAEQGQGQERPVTKPTTVATRR